MELRVKFINKDRISYQVFVLKYAWGCMLYCARWLFVIVLSSYMEGLVEIVYDKSAARRNDDMGCECENQSPVLVTAVSKILQSIICIAFLVPLMVPSMKKILPIKPWFALVLTAVAIQLSDRLESDVALPNSSSFLSANKSICDCSMHSSELSCSLKDRLVSILIGAVCAIYVSREKNIRFHKAHVAKQRANRKDGGVEIDEKYVFNKSSIFGQWWAQIFTILSLLYVFFPITTKTLISFEYFRCLGYEMSLFHVLENLLQQVVWAFLMVTILSRPNHYLYSWWLRAISMNSVWDSFSRFLYPLIFIFRYEVLEHIVKNHFGFFSLHQFLLLIFCIYLVGHNKKGQHEDQRV